MHSSVWGSSYWYILHAISFAYETEPNPEPNPDDFKKIISSIGAVLPCGVCRRHFSKQQKQFPIVYNSRKALTTWLYQRHERVNSVLRKRTRPSYNKVVEEHSTFSSKKVNKFFNYFMKFCKPERLTKYLTIFKLFGTTWPNKDQRSKILEITNTDEYNKISNPYELKVWFVTSFQPDILQTINEIVKFTGKEKKIKAQSKSQSESKTEFQTESQTESQSQTIQTKVRFDNISELTDSDKTKIKEELKTTENILQHLQKKIIKVTNNRNIPLLNKMNRLKNIQNKIASANLHIRKLKATLDN